MSCSMESSRMASGVMMVVVKAGDWRPPVTTYTSVADAWPTHKAADTRDDVSGLRESPARLRHHQFFSKTSYTRTAAQDPLLRTSISHHQLSFCARRT